MEHLELAEDLVQDTLVQAMNSWSYGGIPQHPSAWLYRVAKNKAIDYLRREKKFREIAPQYSYLLRSEQTLDPVMDHLFQEQEIQDSQLRMIFACCHPSIAPESQIAFVLKVLCGLSAGEIARAFITSEEAITKRIYRAKEKIRAEKIELDLPSKADLPLRIDTVLASLYLLFNEGYLSAHPDLFIREELCEEAMRLNYLLTLNPVTNLSRTRALLSLFCFQASRLNVRTDDHGQIILLKYQDRKKWYRPLMEKGFGYLESSVSKTDDTSAYHLEAAIASQHASASSFELTDWKCIYFLYEHLYALKGTPIVALNKAIAAAYALGKEEAIRQLLEIRGLESYHLYHTSLGEIYLELNEKELARKFFETAQSLAPTRKEKEFLESKIRRCGGMVRW